MVQYARRGVHREVDDLSVPAPFVAVAGSGVVTADNLNTSVQVCQNFAQMRTFAALTDMAVFCLGGTSEGDGNQGWFWYNASSTATDNGSTVIVPNGNIQGAWLRLAVTIASITSVRYVTTGTTDTAQNTDSLIAWNLSTPAAATESLPAPTTQGQTFTIKDAAGNSATYPITVLTASGAIIGANVINVAYNSLTFVADGVSKWLVI
jgi:hypothetical protein